MEREPIQGVRLVEIAYLMGEKDVCLCMCVGLRCVCVCDIGARPDNFRELPERW